MRLKEQIKKLGFSLMEIVLALAIIGILLLVTIPVINKQLEKAEEYSYYLAYKTVEKLGGQIVALGDEEETSAMLQTDFKLAEDKESFGKYLAGKFNSNKNKVKIFFATLGQKFAYSEHYIFKKLFTKAFAEITTTVDRSVVTSATYDDLWLRLKVCSGAKVLKNKNYKDEVKKTYDDAGNLVSTETLKIETDPTYWSKEELDCSEFNKTLSDGSIVSNTMINNNLFSSNFCPQSAGLAQTARTYIINQTEPDMNSFCTGVMRPRCTNTQDYKTFTVSYVDDGSNSSDDNVIDPDDEEEGDEVLEGETEAIIGYISHESNPSGYCLLEGVKEFEYNTEQVSAPEPDPPKFYNKDCTDRGYINFYNEAGNPGSYLDCVPQTGYVISANDERAAVKACSKGVTTYAVVNSARTSATQACCKTDFNELKGTCCPDYSRYAGGEECQCVEGYKMQAGKCVRSKCSSGSTLVDGVCVANASLIKASRFCKKITEHWNTNDSSCTGFSTQDGVEYNDAVYKAATGNDNEYLSINSKPEAFKKITPNIVFSNGLKLWILSGKVASIPGLTATPKNATAVQNGCKNIKLATPSAAACSNKNGYYCSNENRCYTLADKQNATVVDARNCCASVDLTDYAEAAIAAGTSDAYKKVSVAYAISGFTVFVDINGGKGNGTLWEDVFPFYVGTNGTVYPAYPLNAAERASDGSEITSKYIAGNSEKQLPVDVYYYEARGDQRQKVVAFPNVSYARGICSARKISKYSPYCLNLGEKYYNKVSDTDALQGTSYIGDDSTTSKNPCDSRPCFVTVRRKLSSF